MDKARMEKILEEIEVFRLMIDDIDGMAFGKVPKALDEIAFRIDIVIHQLVFAIKVAS